MTALFLAPHNDDESLFGAFTIQRQRAHVVTVLRSFYQAERWPAADYGFERREAETKAALAELGATGEQWDHDDRDPDWRDIGTQLRLLDLDARGWSVVYAPFPEAVDGHEQHDQLGRIAYDVWPTSVVFYTTYTRQNGRTVGERFDPTPGEIAGKLRAMAHYGSQLENWLTRPHFMRRLDEYLVAP